MGLVVELVIFFLEDFRYNWISKDNLDTSLSLFSLIRSNDEDQPKIEKLSMKKKGIGSEARAERIANANADLQLFNEAERERQLQKLKKRRLRGRQDEVCNWLTSSLYPSVSHGCTLVIYYIPNYIYE